MKPRYMLIGGKERPLYFGFNALRRVEEETGIPFARIAESFSDMRIEMLILMLDISLQEGARKDKLEYDMSREDLADALDDLGIDGIDQVTTALTSFFVAEGGAEDKPGEAPAL